MYYCIVLKIVLTLIYVNFFENIIANNKDSLVDIFDRKAEKLFNEGDYSTSFYYNKKILEYKENNIKKISKESFAKSYYNIAMNLFFLFDYCNSINYLDKAEAIYFSDTIKYKDKLISVYILKGIIYYNKGDYKRAEFVLNHAIRLLNTCNDGIKTLDDKKIKAYNAIASVYYELKEYNKSLYYYKKAEEIAILSKDLNSISSIKTNIANTATKINDAKIALKYYEDAASIILKMKKLNYFDLLSINNYLIFLIKSNNFKKAKILLNAINNICYKNKSDFAINYLICNIHGDAYFYCDNKIDSSIYFFEKALHFYKNLFKNSIDINYINTLKSLGKAYYKRYLLKNNLKDLYNASKHYQFVIDNIEKLKNSFLTQESRIFLMENEYDIYFDAISILFKLSEMSNNTKFYEEAFYLSEKLKGSILYRMIKENEAKIKSGIPDSILEKESEYKRLITLYREMIYEELKSENSRNNIISKWESKIMEYENKYERLLNYLENNYKNYYNLKYNTTPFGIKEIQKKLKNNDIIVDYIVGDTVLYTFLISKKNFVVNKVNINNNFSEAIKKIYSIVSNINFSKDHDSNFLDLTKSLSYAYMILLKPFEKNIHKKHLIIIPDNMLYYVPFELLLTNYNDFNVFNYKKLPFLIKKHSISYEYSCRLFLENRAKRINNLIKHKVALFAPQYDGRFLSRFRGTRQYNYRKDLFPIPGALQEVEKISNIFLSDIYKGNKASEKNFKMYASNYNILHFAMHTIIDNENPMYSKLVFAEPEDSIEDGFLNAYELYNLTLKADMVVLSSCNSGKGNISKGEGIISISRGFSYAGCSSLLLTLWEIEDAVSSELMVSYYKYLKRGYSKDKALQLAKLTFIENQPPLFSNPIYWAPYVIYGNENSICIRFYYIPILLLVVVSFFILFLLFIRRINSKNK